MLCRTDSCIRFVLSCFDNCAMRQVEQCVCQLWGRRWCSSKRAEVHLSGRAQRSHTHKHAHPPAHENQSTLPETPPPDSEAVSDRVQAGPACVRESARFTRVRAVDRAGAVSWFAGAQESSRFLDAHGEVVVEDGSGSHMVRHDCQMLRPYTTCLCEWASGMHAYELLMHLIPVKPQCHSFRVSNRRVATSAQLIGIFFKVGKKEVMLIWVKQLLKTI